MTKVNQYCCLFVVGIPVFMFYGFLTFKVLDNEFISPYINSYITQYVSYPCTSFLLIAKVISVFVHGPHTKRLGIILTAQEGTFESTFQLILVGLGAFRYNHPINWITVSSALSSVIVIAKGGVENMLLPNLEDRMEENEDSGEMKCLGKFLSFIKKIINVAKFVPLFTLTTVFRIFGIIATFTSESPSYMLYFYLPILPLPFVCISRFCVCCEVRTLKGLNIKEIAVGSVGELGCITIWGNKGREGSRKIQLYFFLYYLAIHTYAIICALKFPYHITNEAVFYPAIIFSLVCGGLSLPLFVWQIMCTGTTCTMCTENE